ncbi:helix-turn-helix transcriptional regulator [Pseudodesulfovibrio portus]|uniref:WYL domain-containing protein n=1 Tax=Pseudodesulfovibrio portus TaxID=231439 RepID=A0ABN6RUA7_9BACT|nr:WYL domain-containing protein [Pseudodesulfovibrio portus]BDQ33391.1 WYL domain-containing protein [Pseudodesulfovibrio portus]
MPPKKNQHAKPTQKAVTLFCQLMYTGKRHYLIDLARELDCSKQTIIRMMEDIDRSYSVRVEKGKDGKRAWYQIQAPRNRPKVALSEDEISHLLLCKEMVRHLLPQGLSKEVDETIHKTVALLPALDNRAQAFESLAGAILKGSIDYTPQEAIITTILNAIAGKDVCEIKYKALGQKEEKLHYFAPLRIKSYREALYVTGWKVDIRAKEAEPIYEMHLPIHRFTAAEPVRKKYFIQQQEKPHHFGFPECEPFRIKVRLTPEAGRYVKERRWSSDQVVTDLDDGRCELEFTAQSETEVLSWVLGFGANIQMLEPESLRATVKSELKKTLVHYSENDEP